MNTGKNFKIFGVRSGLIGDSVMALPILNHLEKLHPDSYKYWLLDKKCSQAAPIYFNHPLIDKILITEQNEGVGPKELEIANNCDAAINPSPAHPLGEDWPNHRNIYEETWIMAGFPLEEYHNLPIEQQRPKLEKWFNIESPSVGNHGRKTIALFPFAGYGREPKRSPSVKWYNELLDYLLNDNYEVFHFGHSSEPYIKIGHPYYCRCTHEPFFEQIKMALGCDLTIGTDSGTALIMGAYEVPQISLLTNHWPGHGKNPLAFATNNVNNQSLFAPNGADNIKIDDVISVIKSI